MRYAEVLVDINNRRLDHTYHYRIPESLKLVPGMRVLVPLQNRKVQALVVGLCDQLPPAIPAEQVRPVLEVIDENQTIPPEIIELARWLAETTLCSLAQSMRTVWPLLKGKVEDWVIPLAEEEDPDIQAIKILQAEMFERLKVLYRARRHGLPVEVFLKRAKIGPQELNDMVEQGLVEINSRFSSQWSAPKAKRNERHSQEADTSEPDTSEPDASRSDTPGLGNIADNVSDSEKSMPHELASYGLTPHELTPAQKRAVAEILSGRKPGQSDLVLLHGVTGSGKTEIYRTIVNEVLAQGLDAIILVPEISLTGQIASYFTAHFGEEVIVLHSGLTPSQKAQAWAEILQGNKRLVIGARSAVFAPLPNLGLIIIDEEQDGAYKQDENPKYHARDVARKRIEQVGGLLLLGSATPSLEAYAAAKAGKLRLVSLTERVANRKLPPVTIVDLRQELINGNRSVFSYLLQAKLKERLERGEQTMLFVNRRGYSTFVICRECGQTVQCPNCDVALTYHAHGQSMRCHYCNHTQSPPVVCPECGSRFIRFFGLGTQRVEEELQVLFPEARILRLDSDITRSTSSHEEILSAFRRQEADILIGTQMMAKGLDFPNVTLVGVIAADQLLNFPDFRSRERTFQLLTQVAGRAGRGEKEGEVIVQTYTPQDRAIVKASKHDYLSFFWDELSYRRERSYPPFTHFLRIMLLHETEDKVVKAAQELGQLFQRTPEEGLTLLGPAPAVIPRLNNKYRWQVLIKGKDLERMRRYANAVIHRFYELSASSGINLSIEINPLTS